MYALLKEIFFYALFLYTLMMVAYGERDQLAYFMVRNSENVFLGAPFTTPAVNESFINVIQKLAHIDVTIERFTDLFA